MANKQKWIDLASHGVFLGDQKMADGKVRLVVLDMENKGDPAKLKEVGFLPVVGSPRYDKGIYYLAGEEQRLRPKALAAAFGIPECPLVDVEAVEIDRVFREKIVEKFGANLNALILQSKPLGHNKAGQFVFGSPAGRFIRLSTDNAVSEGTAQAEKMGGSAFLRGQSDADLRDCAEGFLWGIRQGGKKKWDDLVRFGRVVYGYGESQDVADGQMHRLQEALEAASHQHFKRAADKPDHDAFKVAQSLYFGLPTARMRTSESVFLQQYSTPLPMSVVAQRLVLGNDPVKGRSILEPTAGHACLLNLLPSGMDVCAAELDEKRVAALRVNESMRVIHGDATVLDFREGFERADGFDYTIVNPPFGEMEPRVFDKLKNVRRLDHFIALRALAARKDEGRSVVIFGADSAQSDGTVKGGAKWFLNYLHDHYEVAGVTELDGRLYSRQGAGFNVRLIVIGDKLRVPQERPAPEKLTILTSYDDLWEWSEHLVSGYTKVPIRKAATLPEPEADPSIAAVDVGPATPLFAVDTPGQVGKDIPVEDPGEKSVATLSHPWQMTLKDWSSAWTNAKTSTLGSFTRNSGSQAAAQAKRLDWLKFDVSGRATERMLQAQSGLVQLTGSELEKVSERLQTPVSHRDVIDKALAEGKPVPAEVLADYPDLCAPLERAVNEFQAPYQSASKAGESSAMVPINMAGATYAALNDLENKVGPIDQYVATKLQYPQADLGKYFSAEQIDVLGLGIKSVEEGRGMINADMTGVGKGRFVAGMLRYAKLNGKTPIFLTIKPELFTDIFRDISDINSQDLFKKLFIFNDGVNVKRYGSATDVLYPATSSQERKAAVFAGAAPDGTDMVLGTYSQFMRAYEKNPKSRLLSEMASANGMLLLDESHVAAGNSSLGAAVDLAVSNSAAVVYASATPLKGVGNFRIYRKVLPASVDLETLADTLKAGGEGLQEAISSNMARDGVLVRRELDISQLEFLTRSPSPENGARNIAMADRLSEIVAGLSYLAGDVSREVAELNKAYKSEWADIPDSERNGFRMQASSMNFGSRLYSLNRQFLLGLGIEEAVDGALSDLRKGIKPVIGVENTGEALLREVVARRAGVDELEAELQDLDERNGELAPQESARRDFVVGEIASALRNVKLEAPPQFRELLESMLDRIGVIKVQLRYGEYASKKPTSETYAQAQEDLREKILAFPDLPLTPIDVLKKELAQRGFEVAEVSGRTMSIVPDEGGEGWRVKHHAKADAVSSVAGFQNGTFDAIVITRSGSTGISLHATARFDDSDTRQRNFWVLQRAANIAEFMQWLGRVNRKDQIVAPIITNVESGLPAEQRLLMMHNSKLRKLSANTTSNRDNANLEGEECDLLNDVGDRVALEWLVENPDIAEYLDIKLPSDDEYQDGRSSGQEAPYINKLMGRLMMVPVAKQKEILKTVTDRFAEKLNELEQRGESPFKVHVYDWGASVVREEELQSGVIRATESTFDEPVKIATLRYEKDVHPIRSEKLLAMVKVGLDLYQASGAVDENGSVRKLKDYLVGARDGIVRSQLPSKLRESPEPLREILSRDDVAGAKSAQDKAQWLIQNLESFRPGVTVLHDDPFRGERKGVITGVSFPATRENLFLLSKYSLRVVFPGEESSKDLTLATIRGQGKDLQSEAWLDLNPEKMNRLPHMRRQASSLLSQYDDAPDGKVERIQYVLQGNIFRSVELAISQKLGWPILYTGEDGTRQRAVLLKDRVTPEMVKSLPIGLDAEDMAAYINEFLKPSHPKFRERSMFSAFEIFDAPIREMKRGTGVVLEVLNGGGQFRLSVPGTKAKAGPLMTDGKIFDIGAKTPSDSLRLKLSGSRAVMSAEVSRDQLPELMERMQRGHHVGKFYLPHPDHEVLKELKHRFELERSIRMDISTGSDPTP